MTLGSRIRSSRKAVPLTQAELAQKLGVTVQAVSQWETDKNAPSTANMIALASKLHVALTWLSNGSDPSEVDFTVRQDAPHLPRAPLMSMEYFYRLATFQKPSSEINEASLEISKATGAPVMAIYIDDDSMAPTFVPGDIIFVDIYLRPEPGDFVCFVDQSVEKRVLFRQISFESSSDALFVSRLTPLNPHYQTRVIARDEPPGYKADFAGTLIEHRRFRPPFKKSFRDTPD